jgi:hypothetical protein
MIALVISTTSVSYVFEFPALISLRWKYPDAPRPYRVPGEVAEVPRAAAPADPAPGGP